MPPRIIWRHYIQLLETRPRRAHALSTCALMGVGDAVAQLACEGRTPATYDGARTLRFLGVGLLIAGPAMHVWYRSLERYVTGRSRTGTAFKKMAADQLLFLPVYLVAFIGFMSALRREKPDEIRQKMHRDLYPMLSMSYQLWPAVQMLNFIAVPLKHQILVINGVGLIWNTVLSWKTERA